MQWAVTVEYDPSLSGTFIDCDASESIPDNQSFFLHLSIQLTQAALPLLDVIVSRGPHLDTSSTFTSDELEELGITLTVESGCGTMQVPSELPEEVLTICEYFEMDPQTDLLAYLENWKGALTILPDLDPPPCWEEISDDYSDGSSSIYESFESDIETEYESIIE